VTGRGREKKKPVSRNILEAGGEVAAFFPRRMRIGIHANIHGMESGESGLTGANHKRGRGLWRKGKRTCWRIK